MDINLIPQEEKGAADVRSSIIRVLIISFVTVFLLASFLGIRYLVNGIKINNLIKKEKAVISKEEEFKDFKESFDKYRSHRAMPILYNHTYYSKLLSSIKKSVPSTIKQGDITLRDELKCSINGEIIGGYSFMEISRLLNNIKKEGFLNPKVSSISFTSGEINFTVDFSFSREMILK